MTVFRPASVQEASILSGHYYTAPEIFDQETQRIFRNHWICVGRSEQIADPEDYFLTQIGAEELIVLRAAQGEARAFFNLCRHCGARLCGQAQGHFGETIRCANHNWRYSLEGQLRSARRESASPEENALFGCVLSEWEGFLWVNLAPNPVPFGQTFSPLFGQFTPWQLASLQVGEQVTDDLQANWKLIFQIYCDRYHHTSTARRSPNLSAGAFLGASQPLDRHVPRFKVQGEQCDRVYHYSLFPTMLLSLYPSHAIALRLYPQAADRTRIVCQWLFDRHSAQSADRTAIDWQHNHRQVWLRCEQIQHRMHTTDSIHRSLSAAFDREYLRVLGASTGR